MKQENIELIHSNGCFYEINTNKRVFFNNESRITVPKDICKYDDNIVSPKKRTQQYKLANQERKNNPFFLALEKDAVLEFNVFIPNEQTTNKEEIWFECRLLEDLYAYPTIGEKTGNKGCHFMPCSCELIRVKYDPQKIIKHFYPIQAGSLNKIYSETAHTFISQKGTYNGTANQRFYIYGKKLANYVHQLLQERAEHTFPPHTLEKYAFGIPNEEFYQLENENREKSSIFQFRI